MSRPVLTRETVREVRRLRDGGTPVTVIAHLFRVDRRSIYSALNGVTWKSDEHTVKARIHGSTKYSWDVVCEMRRLRAQGWRVCELAREFGAHQSTVTRILQGYSRKDDAWKRDPHEGMGCRKLTADDVREIRGMRACGASRAVVAKRFSITRNAVSDICGGRRWSHLWE